MSQKLAFSLLPSRLLTVALSSAHAVAAAALWLAAVPMLVGLMGSLCLAAHLVWVLRREALRTAAAAVLEAEWREDCSVCIRLRTGVREERRVDASSFVAPWLTVLSLSSADGLRARSLLVTADSVDAESFRRLRVWLRWRCRGGGAGALGARSLR
jgi:toxin CptA